MAQSKEPAINARYGSPPAYFQALTDRLQVIRTHMSPLIDGQGAFFGNRSIVIHFANKTRLACANFQSVENALVDGPIPGMPTFPSGAPGLPSGGPARPIRSAIYSPTRCTSAVKYVHRRSTRGKHNLPTWCHCNWPSGQTRSCGEQQRKWPSYAEHYDSDGSDGNCGFRGLVMRMPRAPIVIELMAGDQRRSGFLFFLLLSYCFLFNFPLFDI